jgi:hypothetical protein
VATALIALLALVASACGGSAPTPAPASIDTPEAAASLIAHRVPLFDGFGPLSSDMIGQDRYWQADPIDAGTPPSGWKVTFFVGWGDCQAGCIDRHTWTWSVLRDGTVTWGEEAGSVLSEELLTGLWTNAAITGAGGRVTAGPTCPVERPDDPACAPRTVAGAVLVIKGGDGKEVGRVTTDGSGLFRLELPVGGYTLEPQPVEGLMGTAAPTPFSVIDGQTARVDIGYDTGIR